MKLGPFYKNQKPANDLVITVANPVTKDAIDLSSYTSVEWLLASPNGAAIDTTSGTCSISDATAGEVTYVWPVDTLLDEVGDYRWQLKLVGSGVEDYTEPDVFEVHETIA